MACCNVFFYMQGAWYVAKYEAVVRANSIYSSPVQQSDHSIHRVGPRMEKLDNVSIQNWLIDYYLRSSVAISIHVTIMVHDQAFRILAWSPEPSPNREDSPVRHMGMRWAGGFEQWKSYQFSVYTKIMRGCTMFVVNSSTKAIFPFPNRHLIIQFVTDRIFMSSAKQ
jgi:hypothetical protein